MDKVSTSGGLSESTKQVILVATASVLAGISLNYLIKRSQETTKEQQKRRDDSDSSPRSPTKAELNFERNLSAFLQHEAIEYRLKLETTMGHENALLEELRFLDSSTCDIQKVPHLVAVLALKAFPKIVSPLMGDSKFRSVYGGEGFIPEDSFVDQNSYCLSTATFGPDNSFAAAKKYLRAGPRKHIFFSPNEVRACIVTCGRVCPGLNVVIRELHNSLYYNYNVQNIFGIKYGFKGFYEYEWKKLNPKKMRNIHHLGGTILGSSKEPLELDKLMSSIIEHRINQIYCIGGDGTLRAIQDLLKQTAAKKLKLSVCGIIKTIEHDVPFIDKSFGFETAVEEAARAIQSAVVEATGFENAVGLVKLMGRHSGYIAMYAALANREVNVCLVPEFQFDLEGPHGLLEYTRQKVLQKRSCIIVIAEGAGKGVRDADLRLPEVDKEGNPKLQDVGVYLKDRIVKYCSEKGLPIAMKYIDPTYMIRDVAATAYDQQMCSQVAQNAVHGAMAGWTGFAVGNLHGRSCYIPLNDVVSERRRIEATSSDWQKLLTSTGQPSFLNDN